MQERYELVNRMGECKSREEVGIRNERGAHVTEDLRRWAQGGGTGLENSQEQMCMCMHPLPQSPPHTQSHPSEAFRPKEEGWSGPIQSLD